jgi:hypothetical protein
MQAIEAQDLQIHVGRPPWRLVLSIAGFEVKGSECGDLLAT